MISHCLDCDEAIPGDDTDRCYTCQEKHDDAQAAIEFTECLTDRDSDVEGICDRIGGMIKTKPQLIKI